MYDKIKEILKDVKLMIVEDDNLLRNCLKDSIRYYVKEIYDFQNTKSALDMFGKTDINLIITDINMPGINGLKMASLIREIDKDVPIIFITAYDNDENMLKAIEVGGIGVMKKPFEKRDLIMNMSFAVNKFKSNFADVDLKNGFKFNSFSKQLSKNDIEIPLTKKEQTMLHLMLKNANKTVSFDMIENCVWCDESCSADTIRSFVYKLRKKLYPELIQNCQGVGYKLSLSEANERTLKNIRYI